MDSSAVLRAKAINLCPRCMTLFIAPKNEDILKVPLLRKFVHFDTSSRVHSVNCR